MATVLGDGLRRVGTFRLTGTHTLGVLELSLAASLFAGHDSGPGIGGRT
ncbi:hypothetical protein [Streptomyces sp. NPDC002785]